MLDKLVNFQEIPILKSLGVFYNSNFLSLIFWKRFLVVFFAAIKVRFFLHSATQYAMPCGDLTDQACFLFLLCTGILLFPSLVGGRLSFAQLESLFYYFDVLSRE